MLKKNTPVRILLFSLVLSIKGPWAYLGISQIHESILPILSFFIITSSWFIILDIGYFLFRIAKGVVKAYQLTKEEWNKNE